MKREVVIVSLVLAVLAMIVPTQLYASPITEDDGYTYPDDASEEEKEEIDEREQEAWEEAGRPGEIENDNDGNDDEDNDDNNSEDDPPYCDEVDDDYSGSCFDRYDTDDITGLYPCLDGSQVSDPQLCESTTELETQSNELGGEQIFTYSDGSTVTGDEECPSTGPNPYCDTDRGKAAPVCHDRLDYDEDTGLYPCNDGTNKVDWKDCKDATVKNVNNDDDSTKIIQATTTTSNSAEESSCRLDGSVDGTQQKFDSIKYQACGLYTNGQKAYSDGFIVGCAQVGNTQLICQALVDSSILNAKIQPTQMQTQTVTQPTQAIQSTVDANNCRSSGFEDGMNSGFNVNTWINCDADQWMYYEGFVSGCTYYDAFTVDYCENWANGSIK